MGAPPVRLGIFPGTRVMLATPLAAMRVEADKGVVVDGDDVYEFHGNTETHFDLILRGERVAEVDFFYGLAPPEVNRLTIPTSTLSRLVDAWGEHLRRDGCF